MTGFAVIFEVLCLGFFSHRKKCIFGTKQGSLQMYKYKVKQGKVVKTVKFIYSFLTNINNFYIKL